MKKSVIFVIATTVFYAGTSWAADTGATTIPNSASSSLKDGDFLGRAYQINMAEIKMGQLAQKNTKTQETKDYGKMLEEDHKLSQDQVKRLAKNEKVKLPSKVDAEDQAEYDRLEKLKDAAFDSAFATAMTQGHQKAIQLFSAAARSSQSPAVKEYAEMTLPSLRAHEEVAGVVQKTLSH